MCSTRSTRDQIIDTASALLERQGYAATGLNQIVRESGAPKGSLYHYFPGGKDEIAVESLQQGAQAVAERIREALTPRRPRRGDRNLHPRPRRDAARLEFSAGRSADRRGPGAAALNPG